MKAPTKSRMAERGHKEAAAAFVTYEGAAADLNALSHYVTELEAFAAALSSATPAGGGLTDDMNPIKDGWQVSYSADGHAGPGFYAHMTEYPEEGAVLLAASPVPMSAPDNRVMLSEQADAKLREMELEAEVGRLNAIINTPQSDDFIRAVSIEAEHQRQRWGAEGDAGKTPADWFWLVGYLAGKALHSHAAGNAEKAEHHVITTAAACANWHRAIFGKTDMRPGHEDGLDAQRLRKGENGNA